MARPANIRIGRLFRKLTMDPLWEPMLAHLDVGDRPVAAGWGYRPSGRNARAAAARNGVDLLLLEDAFVRSLRPGCGPAYGWVADSRGIYYDATGASDLIEALNTGVSVGWMAAGNHAAGEVADLMERFRHLGVSKYNWYAPLPDDGFGDARVIVFDQTRGDAALRYGGVGPGDFERMVRDALDEHPGKTIHLRTHPDHRYRGKHSCFPDWVFREPRIALLPPDLPPAACFRGGADVYVATSLVGFEALMHGARVRSYGWNFYAGWGLTEDRGAAPAPPRSRRLGLEELFEFSYLRYCHYFDPDTREPCSLGRILDHIATQQEIWRRCDGGRITVGWTPWQRKLAEKFVRGPEIQVRHADTIAEARALADASTRLLLWGGRIESPPDLPWDRVEDGFLRSAGLGAAFHVPYSWVFDDLGIYFDARTPSRLERLLAESLFSPGDLADAAELMAFLREMRLTKYNLRGGNASLDPAETAGRKVILVPGQVEADASIAFGSPELKSNLALLQRVRAMEPDAYIVFKAHPDLVAGARHGNVLPPGFAEACDLAVTGGNVLDWLDLCDEVHTMTSTVGFEALIRGKPVVTYGMPFYAGWGLTTDRLRCERRTRRLTIEELVCGALIRYPRYLNPETGEFTTALMVARLLVSPQAAADRRPWHLKGVSKLKRMWVEWARRRPSP